MSTSTTWRGRRGSVLLGPTEHRVARYLADRTSHGKVPIRTLELAAALGLERSEAYRVTRRLRVLGLFGVRDDRGGTLGGRWYWRTAIAHDGAGLDPRKHRVAWARVLGAARIRAAAVADFIRRRSEAGTPLASTSGPIVPPRSGPSFRELFAAAPGGTALLELWGVT